ncbi:uncharacterized protein LAJ45_06175 [Morchella importuna]|uniref:uncharacterized protein n=1 Tax=Morchella importuna TaxID=1174673 RepID=UPI001E8D2D85|nr:uncharacterized protein LAJ45_06175 [Morchella importuna]KAH8149547.1 hypothetical protein LAJ45_06175 [Morchella importuna]
METAGFVFGVLPVAASLFKSTLSLYTYYSECQELGKTSSEQQVLLRIEQFRYQSWGNIVGLDADDLITNSQSYPDINLPLTVDILSSISQLLLDASKLEKKYRSTTTRNSNAGLGANPNTPAPFESAVESGRENLATLAQDIKSCLSLKSSIKFLIWDRTKLDTLIRQLKAFNDGLENVTAPHSRNQLYAKLITQALDLNANGQQQQLQSLSALISATETTYPTLAEMAKRRAAYLELQDRQLKQRNNRRKSPSAEDPHLKLDHTKMDLIKTPVSPGRFLGTYCGTPVIVEWKTLSVDGGLSENESLCRIRDLAKFLSKKNDGKKEDLTHLLESIGYFRWPGETDRVALVYENPRTSVDTLKGLLKNPDYEQFNLGARFRLARSLAECVFFLHLTGWLHKGLYSDNVVICGDGSTGQSSTETKALQLYVSGFSAARLDGQGEKSEKIELEAHIDLYHHPKYQGPMKDRIEYTRQYDIYSLGLLLLELGTWQTIDESGGFKQKKHDPTSGLKDDEKSMLFWKKVVLELTKSSIEE